MTADCLCAHIQADYPQSRPYESVKIHALHVQMRSLGTTITEPVAQMAQRVAHHSERFRLQREGIAQKGPLFAKGDVGRGSSARSNALDPVFGTAK